MADDSEVVPGEVVHARRTPEVSLESLRAISNETRLRLYEALVAAGPSTNAQLAQTVAGAPGTLSYHLRQLEQAGFVEQVTNTEGDARKRWWRAIPGGVRWTEDVGSEDEALATAVETAERVMLQRNIERQRTWTLERRSMWSRRWRTGATTQDTILHLTADQLNELSTQISQVLDRWIAHEYPPNNDSPMAATETATEAVYVAFHAFPLRQGSSDSPP